MKAIVMAGPKQSRMVDLPQAAYGDDEVLIKLKYVGVCMSERDAWKEAREGDAFGHEPLGVIAAVGKNVKGFSVGERVSGLWGSTMPGAKGLVQYQAANPKDSAIVKIPDNLRDEDAIVEPLSCILSAVSKARVRIPGDTVCVVGCGYMGCGAISLLKMMGCHVVAVDIRPQSLANAAKYGADECYAPAEALQNYKDTGFETVMEWGETNESLDLAIHLTRTCGQLCVGSYHTGGKRLVDMQQLNMKAIECLSTHPREQDLNYACARRSIELLAADKWKYVNLPVKIYPMSLFDQAYLDMETKYGVYMKAIIDMEAENGEPYLKSSPAADI